MIFAFTSASPIAFLILILVVFGIMRSLASGSLARVAVKCLILLGVLLVIGVVSLMGLVWTRVQTVPVGMVNMPGVTVSPFGVEVRGGNGETVKVSPFGVQVHSRKTNHTETVHVDAGASGVSETVETEELPGPALPV